MIYLAHFFSFGPKSDLYFRPLVAVTMILLPGLLTSEIGSLLEDLDFNILIPVFYSLSLLYSFSKQQFPQGTFWGIV